MWSFLLRRCFAVAAVVQLWKETISMAACWLFQELFACQFLCFENDPCSSCTELQLNEQWGGSQMLDTNCARSIYPCIHLPVSFRHNGAHSPGVESEELDSITSKHMTGKHFVTSWSHLKHWTWPLWLWIVKLIAWLQWPKPELNLKTHVWFVQLIDQHHFSTKALCIVGVTALVSKSKLCPKRQFLSLSSVPTH